MPATQLQRRTDSSRLLAQKLGESEFAQKIIVDTSVAGTVTTYIALALPGATTDEAVWRASKIVEVTSGDIITTTITWADGNAEFDNLATDITALSYSVIRPLVCIA